MRNLILAVALSTLSPLVLSTPLGAGPLAAVQPPLPHQRDGTFHPASRPVVVHMGQTLRAAEPGSVGEEVGAADTVGMSNVVLARRQLEVGEPSPVPRPAWPESARPRPSGHGADGKQDTAEPHSVPPGGVNKDGEHAIVPRNSTVDSMHPRAGAHPPPDNVVKVASSDKFCLIMPRDRHTDVGDSEHPGGMKTYCSKSARYSEQQGLIPDDFWRAVQYKAGHGQDGQRFVQLTGCIRPEKIDRLNPSDAGGQYDSSGGADQKGNPQSSVCLGYKHYVELVEPAGPRACIRCCDDPADCPTHQDTQGCPNVIPGEYFDCA